MVNNDKLDAVDNHELLQLLEGQAVHLRLQRGAFACLTITGVLDKVGCTAGN